MTGRVQTLRSTVAGNRPTGRQPGELYVNWADNQFGVINASSAAQDLLAIPFFSTLSSYAIGAFVVYNGQLYRALAPSSPGAFVPANWAISGGAVSVGDNSPSNPQPGALWWDSVGGQLYVWFVDANSSQWVVANNAASVLASGYLPLSGGTLTGPLTLPGNPTTPLQSVPKQYVDSLPVAMNDNRIINGDMRIDQRNNGAAGTAVNTYTLDRWMFQATQTAKLQWGRYGGGLVPGGFSYWLGVGVASLYTALATDYFQLVQRIEADMINDFMFGTAQARPVTLSFWANASFAGTFSGSLSNDQGNRCYPFTYVLAANVWTFVSVTIPGDTVGSWVLNGNGIGAIVRFDLGSGANFRSAAGVWTTNNSIGVTGTASVVSTTSGNLNITGVKLEIGSVATPYNRQSMAKSLADCQRYYINAGGISLGVDGFGTSAGYNTYAQWAAPVTMRATPTVNATWTAGVNANSSPITAQSDARTIQGFITSAATGGYSANLNVFSLSAEL